MDEMINPDPVFEEWLEAARRGDAATLVDHLDRGMDVNAGDAITNTTALMSAVWGCQTDTIRLLLDRGADPNAENSLGFTAVTCAVIHSRSWGTTGTSSNPIPGRWKCSLRRGDVTDSVRRCS